MSILGNKFDFLFGENGQLEILYIDKGNKKTNVGNKLSDFIIEKQIGKGNFGSVYLVKSKITNKVYAMKEIKSERYKNDSQKAEIQKEIKLLENLDHPHVITYFSSFSENGNFYIITEYINGGNLDYIIKLSKDKGQLVNEKKIWDVLVQTLSGLVYLHDNKKIIHRDIKPDNILFDKESNIKITDFGISAINKEDVDDNLKCHGTCIGPVQYMAPEMVNGSGNYDFKSDIYMLGLTIFKLMCGKLPEKKIIQNDDIFVALNQKVTLPDYYSKDLKNFVKTLLSVDIKERPTARNALIDAIVYFTLKYTKTTSILSVLNCFLSIPNLESYFKGEQIKELIEKDIKRDYITTKTVKKCFECINPNNFNYEESRNQCFRLRLLLYSKNDKLRNNPEIEVMKVIEDICNEIHHEISKNKGYNYIPKPGSNIINEEYMNEKKEEEIDDSNLEKIIENTCKKFQEKYRSILSDLIYFISQSIYQCPECDKCIKITPSFNCAYALRPERAAARFEKKNLTIPELFEHSGLKRIFSETNIYCKYCQKNENRVKIYKKLYFCPKNLILGFNYSNEDNFNLQIEEYIDISFMVERKDINKAKYRLIGAIFTEQIDDEDKKYVSYYKDKNNQWKYCNGRYISNSDLNEIQNHRKLEILFYTSL